MTIPWTGAGAGDGAGGGSEGGGGAPGFITRAAQQETRRLILDNGFIDPVMQRARQIHDAVWSVLEARSGAPSPFITAQMRDAANNGKVFLSENGTSGETRSVEDEGTTEQQSLVMTIDELWRGLTVDDFVSTLECHCTDGDVVAAYRQENKKLGEWVL